MKAKRFPNLDRIARALELGDSPVPRQVRDFLAHYITGRVKKPRGGQKLDLIEKSYMKFLVDDAYSCYLEETKVEKAAGTLNGTPSEATIERVAEEMDISFEKVRDILYRKNGWED